MTTGQKLLGTALGLVAGWGLAMGGAIAADNVVLSYGLISLKIPMGELETLAKTGEASDDLGRLLQAANQEPAALQRALIEPVPMNPVLLNIALNTPPGEWALDRLGESIQTSSGEGSRFALRASLIAAASDGQLTLLEVMKVYPSPDIVVQGDRILASYSEVIGLLGPFLEYLPASVR
jgi:hypothetical protein